MKPLMLAAFMAALLVSLPTQAKGDCSPSRDWQEVQTVILSMNRPYIAFYELADPVQFTKDGESPDLVGYFYKPNHKNQVLVFYVKNGCVLRVSTDIPASEVWLAERK